MTETQIEISGTVVLDADGNGSVMLGPSVVREYWKLTLASVSVSTAIREATVNLYLGTGATPGRRVTGTATGSSGDTAGLGEILLQPGQTILARFEGGDAGSTATLNVIGSKGRYAQ